MSESVPLTVAIPTFGRNRVLVETLQYLLALPIRAAEIIVVDQTPTHDAETESKLKELADAGAIRWLRLKEPSIPAAMNRALRAARSDLVLFLDDDILPDQDLVAAHFAAHAESQAPLVAGRVLQPWDEGRDFSAVTDSHHFTSLKPAQIREFMGGNFSVNKGLALSVGGFDENFVRVAYRFEAEFAHRWLQAGWSIAYEPLACLHHLKVDSGGTRSYGHHLTTWLPAHSVGAYYFALRANTPREFLARPFGAIATRYHLRHPWRIPATLIAEFGGMLWALALYLRGPRRAESSTDKSG